jgi:hypothetical protein
MTSLTWAIEEEKAEQQLRLLQEQNRQKITADRIGIYRQIIAAGDIERFAYQLAEHPDDIAAVEKIIREEQRVNRRDTIDFVGHMVDSGVIERWQVSDDVAQALTWLRDATTRVIPDGRDQDAPGLKARERRRGRGTPAAPGPEPDLQQDSTGEPAGPGADDWSGQDG